VFAFHQQNHEAKRQQLDMNYNFAEEGAAQRFGSAAADNNKTTDS
jgi:hypothetical protein